jgi:hypothetical protein
MTPSGWESFNSPCCHHRGEKADTRGRGGIIFKADGFNFHCFNCNFKAGWTPGHVLSKNTRNLLLWLGVPDSDVQKLSLEAIRAKDSINPVERSLNLTITPKQLPQDCKTINQWINEGCEDNNFVAVIAYILNRGMQLDWYDWMWSNEPGYQDRVVIPYYFEGVIVGWTARKITDGRPKYLTSAQPSYVFNLDRQIFERQYVILLEGPMDAIPVDGVAVMSNELSAEQIFRINALGKEVIVVPDKDIAGTKLINTAIDQNWSVSLPEWGNDVKDVADAVLKYGRIYTLYSILKYRERGEIKLTMIKKRVERNAEE